MEASALPASVGLARPRLAFGASLLRIRSDDQLVTLFRAGNEDAFRVIHDRYRVRLHAYTRQMLAGSPHDCEDALQEVFVRAYFGLRTNRRDLALRPWLYRVAHNRCVDELRRPPLALVEPDENVPAGALDPAEQVEQRDALRRLISDVQRLPDQQRSALLMRELSGMSYQEVAGALGVSVPAVKSLLVRARVGLAQATEARDTSCAQIREELILAHDRKVRASGLARRHLSECADCRQFRTEMRGVSRQLAALAPTLGPIGVIANLLGFGGGGATRGKRHGGRRWGRRRRRGRRRLGRPVRQRPRGHPAGRGRGHRRRSRRASEDDHRAAGPPRPPPRVARPGGTRAVAPRRSRRPAAASPCRDHPATGSASPVMVAAAVVSAAHAAAPTGHAPARLPISQILDPDHLAFTRPARATGRELDRLHRGRRQRRDHHLGSPGEHAVPGPDPAADRQRPAAAALGHRRAGHRHCSERDRRPAGGNEAAPRHLRIDGRPRRAQPTRTVRDGTGAGTDGTSRPPARSGAAAPRPPGAPRARAARARRELGHRGGHRAARPRTRAQVRRR